MTEEAEFELGTIVTIDRYNHIDDTDKAPIIGYGELPISGRLTYKVNIQGIIIETTGASIVESKLYIPVPENERHDKIKLSLNKK
jgi:hypothetical protein